MKTGAVVENSNVLWSLLKQNKFKIRPVSPKPFAFQSSQVLFVNVPN